MINRRLQPWDLQLALRSIEQTDRLPVRGVRACGEERVGRDGMRGTCFLMLAVPGDGAIVGHNGGECRRRPSLPT